MDVSTNYIIQTKIHSLREKGWQYTVEGKRMAQNSFLQKYKIDHSEYIRATLLSRDIKTSLHQ